MLKLRPIGINDYSVLESGQRIGRIRFAEERLPPRWLWNVTVHLPGGLPSRTQRQAMPALETARADRYIFAPIR